MAGHQNSLWQANEPGQSKSRFSFPMIKFKKKKDPNSDTLVSFDMDETLFSHDKNKLRIHVVDGSGNRIATLTNQEFNIHVLPEGCNYDFSEFRSSEVFIKSAKPIRQMIVKMNSIHKSNKNVEILTARGDLDDLPKFSRYMRKYGVNIDEIRVRRAGNLEMASPALSKAIVMNEIIKQNGYRSVHLYDDSRENLEHFLALKDHHPEVEFHAHHVDYDPKTGNVVVNTEKK